MIRLLAFCVSVALAAIAAAFAVGASATANGVSSSASTGSILTLLDSKSTNPSSLVRLNTRTLRPEGASVSVPEYHDAWAFSPSSNELALARGGQGVGIEIVDFDKMRVVREIHTGIAAEALAWFPRNQLVASLQRGGTELLDANTGRVLRRWPNLSFPDASASTQSKLILLIPPHRSTSPAMPLARVAGHPLLAVVDSSGQVRQVVLGRITLGVQHRGGLEFPDHAALAIDPRSQTAIVFTAGSPLAVIDLRNMHVEYRRVSVLSKSKLGAAQGNCAITLAHEREAVWIGAQRVVIAGRDLCAPWGAGSFRPAGAFQLNTSTWQGRPIDFDATAAVRAEQGVIVYGGQRTGLRIYKKGTVRMLLPHLTITGVFPTSSQIVVRTMTRTYALEGAAMRPRLVRNAPAIVGVFVRN